MGRIINLEPINVALAIDIGDPKEKAHQRLAECIRSIERDLGLLTEVRWDGQQFLGFSFREVGK